MPRLGELTRYPVTISLRLKEAREIDCGGLAGALTQAGRHASLCLAAGSPTQAKPDELRIIFTLRAAMQGQAEGTALRIVRDCVTTTLEEGFTILTIDVGN
jgi:hypothetical protein